MSTTKVTIECGSTQNYIELGVRDVAAFEQACAGLEAQGHSGHELVNALLESQPENIPFVKRYTNGALNDGPNGEAAMITDLRPGAAGYKVEHYKNGHLNDPENGEPAVTISGKGAGYEKAAAFAKHYQEGRWHDGLNGEPSYQMFNSSGKLVAAFRSTEKDAMKPVSHVGNKTLRKLADSIVLRKVQKKYKLEAPQAPF